MEDPPLKDGATLSFVDCSFTVSIKKKGTRERINRTLIDHVSANIPAGAVLAVMGPSGAGKTTLLNMLMLEPTGGKPSGHVTLNGHPFDLKMYTKYCAVVTQYDCLWWSLSPLQHVNSALSFFQPQLSSTERKAAAQALIDEMGLTGCQHTRAGNQFFKGLSGGQRRRLSLAIALCKKPYAIFLDEPTSGLDAAAAAAIMAYLKKIASTESISVFCTIHSPSAAVFDGFDQVLFLTGGRPAYLGEAHMLSDYLTKLHRPIPKNTNPADHMLDLINKDFNHAEHVEEMVAAWREQQPPVEPPPQSALRSPKPAGVCMQTGILLKKHFGLIFSDPVLYLGRLISYPIVSLLFLIIYIRSRDLEQEQVEQRSYFINWLLGIPAMMGLIAVFALNQELVIVRRELKDGMYSVLSYTLATSIIQAPMVFLLSFFTLVPAAYPGGNIEWVNFPIAWLSSGCTLLAMEYLAQLLSLFRNPLVGMLLFMNCWFVLFLFVGVLFNENDVPWPFRVFAFITPLKYGFTSMIWAIFIDTPPYSGALPCNSTNPQCRPGGFWCPDDDTGTNCFGITGEQILTSTQSRYPSVSAKEQWGEYNAYSLIFALFMKICFTFVLTYQSSQAAKLAPPAEAHAGDGATEMHASGNAKAAAEEAATAATAASASASASAPVSATATATATAAAGAAAEAEAEAGGQAHHVVDVDAAPAPASASAPASAASAAAMASAAKVAIGSGVGPDGEVKVSSSFKSKAVEADFQFKACSVSVKPKKKRPGKLLVDNLGGTVEAGSVLAILGPSGAGKTTLLKELMLEDMGLKARGLVTLNGHPFSLRTYSLHACVVQQTDHLWWALTAREHVHYAVNMYQAMMPLKERVSLVESLIKNTGLEDCQHTKAGNIFFKGLSGGQKRRLSCAVALAKRPHVLFLDEPTSGLDAAAAASITVYLKQVAMAEKIAVLCTIHQPSSSVFHGFDKVLFLTGGKPAFMGPAQELNAFLERIGKPVPLNTNPADFMLDLINKDFGRPEDMEQVVAAWAKEMSEVVIKEQKPLTEKKRSTFKQQFGVLLRKHSRLLVVDPLTYGVRMVMFLSGTILFALIYLATRKLEQPQVINRMWLAMWTFALPTSLGVVAIYLINTDFHTVKREVKDGMYGTLPYVLAQSLLQLPMLAILSLLALFPAIYPISNWEISQLWRAYPMYLVTLACFEFTAEFLAVLFTNPLIGMLLYINLWFLSFVFSGVLVRESDVIWPVRCLVYLSPYRWSFGELTWAALIDTPDYEGTAPCDLNGTATGGPLVGQTVNCPRGFYCPDDLSGVACWGRTGQEILTGLSSSFAAISSSDEFGRDIGIVLALAIAFKSLYALTFAFKCRQGRVPEKPETPEKQENGQH